MGNFARWLQPWTGRAFRHVPAGRDVLDFAYLSRNLPSDNRWNGPGEPTLYLAGSIQVAHLEYWRHFEEDRSPALAQSLKPRTLWSLTINVASVLDLRSSGLCQALGHDNSPFCFTDKQIARSTATFLRSTTEAAGLIVPCIAMLDPPSDQTAANLVLFLEKLPREAKSFVTEVTNLGDFPLGFRPN